MANPKKNQANPATTPSPESGLRYFREILGQDWVVSHLKAARLAGRLSHAYLFLGPSGVGKATTARALAAALNCAQLGADGDACGTCPSCRRLQAGTHPDFLMISPEEGEDPDQDRADPGTAPPDRVSAPGRRLAGRGHQARRSPDRPK